MNIESSIQKIIFQTYTRSLKVDSNISTFCFDAKFKDLKVYAMFSTMYNTCLMIGAVGCTPDS